MRTITRTAFAVAGAVALVGGSALSASAVTDTTGATVQVTAGALTVSAPGPVVLSATAPGGTATATLGTTAVSDLTADAIGWEATVTASDFANGGVVLGSPFVYTPGAVSSTGTATVVADDLTDTVTADPVVGNNTASWGADISIAIPADALAGTYTGVITTEVL